MPWARRAGSALLGGALRAADGALAVALAPECAACAAPLDRIFDGPVCAACWAGVRLLTPPLCALCGTPLPSGRSGGTRPGPCCRACLALPPLVARERSSGPYDGALRAIIHAFKYDRRKSLAHPLGALVARQCYEALQGADASVPVPLHWRRRRERGFNQAHEVARTLGLPVLAALRRTRHTRVQASLHANDRRANVAGAFELVPWVWMPAGLAGGAGVWRMAGTAKAVRGATLVLVDDVTTTGATVEACARVLLAAGAREVRAVTIARVSVRGAR